jgi:hypothetical protein
LASWSTVLTTNISTNFPYLYYRETHFPETPGRFYRLAPGP